MKYYAYYSAEKELRDEYTDEFILYMEAHYPGYGRIFHDTKEHRILLICNGEKKNIKLTDIEEAKVRKKSLYSQTDDKIHTALMKKLADRLSSDVTVVFENVMSLGNTLEQIREVYEYFVEKKIYMQFEKCKNLDSNTILKLNSISNFDLTKYIDIQIEAYISQVKMETDVEKKLADQSRAKKKELQ